MKHAPTSALTRASLLACATLCASSPLHAAKTWTGAADATWANTANWLETALPGTTETVNFNASSLSNLTIDSGANRTIHGIAVTSPAGPVTIQNNVLTIGSGGIDMAAATQNLTLASPNNVIRSGAFRWDVPAGRILALAAVPHRNSPNLYGGGNNDNVGGVIRVATTGTVNLTTPNLLVVSDAVAAGGSGGNNPFMTYGDSAFAATDASGNVIAATNVAWTASVGTAFSGSPSAVGASFTQTGNGGFQGIVFNDATSAHTVTFAGSTTFTGRAVLMTPGCVGGTITGGSLRANRSSGTGGTSGCTFSFIQNSTSGDLTIASPIPTASSSTPTAITKSGAGKLILAGNNGYNGRTYIHEGTLQVGAGGTTGTLSGGNVINNAALVIDRSDAITAAQIISGTGTLTKNGTGTLTLGNASTYTGATTLNGGMVSIGAAASFGATSSLTLNGGGVQWSAAADISAIPVVTIGSAGTTFDTGANAVTLANPIGNSGSGSLTKSGSGSLTLGGANTYSGGTMVNAGTLLATNTSGSATGSGPVTVQAGGALGGAGIIAGDVVVESGGKFTPGSSVGSTMVGSLDLDAGSALEFEFNATPANDQITVADAGGLTIDGGTITLLQEGTTNAFAAVGTYNLIAYSGSIGGAGPSSLSVANPQPGFSYTFGTSGGFVTLAIATTGVVRNWQTDGGGSWGNAVNWNGTVPNGLGAIANFHVNLSAAATVTLDGNRTVGAITFQSNTGFGYTIAQGSGGGSLVLNNGTSNASVLDGLGIHTISAPVTMTSNTLLDTAGVLDSITLGGVVSGGGTLTKTGAGSLSLLSSNTFTNLFTVSAGTVDFATGGLGSGNLSLAGSKLVWNPGNTQDISNRTITLAGNVTLDIGLNDVVLANPIGNGGIADVVKAGLGKLTVSGDATYSGTTTISAGTLQLGNGGVTGSVPGDIVNNGALVVNRSGAVTLSGVISGTGSLAHVGNGSVVLEGTNTFSGATTIGHAAGVLTLFNALGLQNSTLSYETAGGTLSFDTNAAATLGALEGGKDLDLTNTSAGAVALTVGGNGASTTYSGKLTGLGSLAKAGGGTLTLAGDNSYAGATNLNGVTFPAINTLELPVGGKIATTGVFTGTSTLFHVNGGQLTSSAQSTVDNRGFSTVSGFQLSDGSAAFNGGIRTSTNDGCLIWVSGGAFTASNVTLQRTRNYNAVAEGPSSTTPAYTEMDAAIVDGFVVSGGTAAIGALTIGTSNSGASAMFTGGSTTVSGVVTIGNTTNNRWSMLQVAGGTFTSTDAASGIVLSPHDTTANKSMLKLTGGVATVERIGFGTTTATTGTGVVWLKGGELYLGSGGMVVDAPAFTSTLRLTTGTLGASADWSSSLPADMDGAMTIKAASATNVAHHITLSGALSGTGSLEKTGAGSLTLSGGYSYTGNTKVSAGTLVLNAASLADTAAVDITTGAVLNLPHGAIDIVADFRIDGVSQGPGTYTAANTGGKIAGTGSVRVIGADPFSGWIGGFAVGGLNGKNDDPDADGLTNLEEFGLDGNPAGGAASGKVRARIEAVGAEQALVITLPVRDGATFAGTTWQVATIDDVRYTIEGTNNLTVFDQVVSEIPVSATGMPALSSGWTYRSFRLNGAIGGATPRGPKGFLSATVEDAP